jgi:hypothetical protein
VPGRLHSERGLIDRITPLIDRRLSRLGSSRWFGEKGLLGAMGGMAGRAFVAVTGFVGGSDGGILSDLELGF